LGFLVLALWPMAAAAAAASPLVQDWRRAAIESFDIAWQTINDTFYDPTFGGLDWRAVRAELRPAVQTAESPEAAREVLRRMLARLGRSHFALLSSASGASAPWPGDARVPIDVRVLDERIVVTEVLPDSSAARAGVRPGDILLSVDGQPIPLPDRDEGTDRRVREFALWRTSERLLHGPAGSVAQLRLRAPDGGERAVTAERAAPPGEIVRLGTLPPLPVRVESRVFRTGDGRRVGLIRFNAWMAAIDGPVARAVDEMRTADGLVIDLRGNGGGLAEMIRGVAGHLFDEPVVLGRTQMRERTLEFRANPRRSTPDGRRVEPYAGPVALLVDGLTGSASECFAGALQALGRARVFGRPTLGQALPALTRVLPSGDTLMYGIGDFVTSTGARLEGEGVQPDELLPLSISALAAGRDEPLEAALAWLETTPGVVLRKP
jgi:carboxyl-terminal processing protease